MLARIAGSARAWWRAMAPSAVAVLEELAESERRIRARRRSRRATSGIERAARSGRGINVILTLLVHHRGMGGGRETA